MSLYKINGTLFNLQPTLGKWLPREQLGRDGNGHAIYAGVYQFEMQWQLSSISDYYQLLGFFDSLAETGTVSVSLPMLRSSTGGFYTYNGCVIDEPEFGGYFNNYPQQISMLVSNIVA